MKICKRCIIPLEEEFTKYLSPNYLPLRGKEGFCNPCYTLQGDPNFKDYFGSRNIFSQELESFFDGKKRVVFAYSGGLDSTVVLDRLKPECDKRGIDLVCFTIDHGFKGVQTMENVRKVIEFEGLGKNFQLIDITKKRTKEKKTIIDFYADLFEGGILPCGALCNHLVDKTYRELLNTIGEDVLITGGDTPKFNQELGRFSIFWKKPGFVVLRGGAAFGLNKKSNRKYAKEKEIPWEDPGCGGYDTDCLLPGAVLRKIISPGKHGLDEILIKLPVVIDYFSERVRWGVIEREQAFSQILEIETSGEQTYQEILRIVSKQKP